MDFEPHQPLSKVKVVNKSMDRMKVTLEEARSALAKVKDDMAHYYNQHRTPAPSFAPRDKVYLDSEDIQTTRPSKKLLHRQLAPLPDRETCWQIHLPTNPPALDEMTALCL